MRTKLSHPARFESVLEYLGGMTPAQRRDVDTVVNIKCQKQLRLMIEGATRESGLGRAVLFLSACLVVRCLKDSN